MGGKQSAPTNTTVNISNSVDNDVLKNRTAIANVRNFYNELLKIYNMYISGNPDAIQPLFNLLQAYLNFANSGKVIANQTVYNHITDLRNRLGSGNTGSPYGGHNINEISAKLGEILKEVSKLLSAFSQLGTIKDNGGIWKHTQFSAAKTSGIDFKNGNIYNYICSNDPDAKNINYNNLDVSGKSYFDILNSKNFNYSDSLAKMPSAVGAEVIQRSLSEAQKLSMNNRTTGRAVKKDIILEDYTGKDVVGKPGVSAAKNNYGTLGYAYDFPTIQNSFGQHMDVYYNNMAQ